METTQELINNYKDGLLNRRELFSKCFMMSTTVEQDEVIRKVLENNGYVAPKSLLL